MSRGGRALPLVMSRGGRALPLVMCGSNKAVRESNKLASAPLYTKGRHLTTTFGSLLGPFPCTAHGSFTTFLNRWLTNRSASHLGTLCVGESMARAAVEEWVNNMGSSNVVVWRIKELLRNQGRWLTNGTVALNFDEHEGAGELRISIVTLSDTLDLGGMASFLDQVLVSTEWYHPKLAFTSVPTSAIPLIQDLLVRKKRGAEPVYLVHARLWALLPGTTIPDEHATGGPGVMGSLNPSEAELVDSYWDMRWPGSAQLVRDCISERPSACLRIEGTPVCWAIVRADGAIGSLYTLEGHRGRGYAVRVVHFLCAALRAVDRPVYCDIVVGNTPSEKFFTSMGFRSVAGSCGRVSWLKLGSVTETTVRGSAPQTVSEQNAHNKVIR